MQHRYNLYYVAYIASLFIASMETCYLWDSGPESSHYFIHLLFLQSVKWQLCSWKYQWLHCSFIMGDKESIQCSENIARACLGESADHHIIHQAKSSQRESICVWDFSYIWQLRGDSHTVGWGDWCSVKLASFGQNHLWEQTHAWEERMAHC